MPNEDRVEPRGGGGVLPEKVGVCGPLPKTLTVFMTKICDIPYPIYDLTFKSKLRFGSAFSPFPVSLV